MYYCVSFVSVVVRKYPNKKQLMEQRFNLAYISRLWSIAAAEPQWQEHGAVVASHRRNACMRVCWHASLCSILFPHFSTGQDSLPREWCHTVGRIFPHQLTWLSLTDRPTGQPSADRQSHIPAQCRQPLTDAPFPGNSRWCQTSRWYLNRQTELTDKLPGTLSVPEAEQDNPCLCSAHWGMANSGATLAPKGLHRSQLMKRL